MTHQTNRHKLGTAPIDATQDTEEPFTSFNLGEKLNVIKRIGSGGMGTVFEVYHTVMGAKRAVKVLDNDLFQRSEQALMRFRQEAIIASELSHPNIIRVYDLDHAPDGNPFIMMELLEGSDLEQIIEQRAPMQLDEVIRLLAGPADALDAVHRKGVVHRDLKPANLFVTDGGTVKVLDFGISQFNRDKDTRITRAGEVVGTPMYMSPEQIMDNNIDGKSDVYALGIIAYEMLTGHPIFAAQSINKITASVLLDTPAPASTHVRELPAHVDDVIMRALSKDPEKRYPTAMTFLRELAGPQLSHVISTVIRSDLMSAVNSSEFSFPYATTADHTDDRSGTTSKWNRDQSIGSPQSRGIVLGVVAAALCLLLGFGGLVAYKSLFSPQVALVYIGKTNFVSDSPDAKWQRDAFETLLKSYLQMDPRIHEVDQETSFSEQSAPLGQYYLHTTVKHNDDWVVTLHLTDKNKTHGWSTSAKGNGFELALEKATWELHDFLGNQSWQSKRSMQNSKEANLSMLAANAIGQQVFLPRLERVVTNIPPSPSKTFWTAFERYLKCVSGSPPRVCLTQAKFPPYQQTPLTGVNALWQTLDMTLPQQSRCKPYSANTPLLSKLKEILPENGQCAGSKAPICMDTSSFWKRFRCAVDSAENDSVATSLEYIFDGMERDSGNGFYGNVDILFRRGMKLEKGKQWLQRMKARYGNDAAVLSNLQFSLAMSERNSAEALIKARRSTSHLTKMALALQASGWLKEGIRKHGEALNEQLGKTGTRNRKHVVKLIRDSIYPMVITQDPFLARTWLAEVNVAAFDYIPLKDAADLLEAIAHDSLDSYCNTASSHEHFPLETLYVCNKFSEIDLRYRMTPDSAPAQAHAAYFVADSLLRLNQPAKAQALFQVIESKTDFRINYPVASIIAIQKLGEIALQQQPPSTQEALKMFKKFVSVWESLDIPLESYLEATDYIVSIGN